MKNKMKLLVAAAAAVVLLGVNVYDRFILTPARQLDFSISPVTVFCGFAGRPLFWMLAGFLVSFLAAGRFVSAPADDPLCGNGDLVCSCACGNFCRGGIPGSGVADEVSAGISHPRGADRGRKARPLRNIPNGIRSWPPRIRK